LAGRSRARSGLLCGVLLLILCVGFEALASVESEIAFHRGIVAYGEGRLEDARTEFERVLQEDPGDVAAIRYLGLISQGQKQFDEAVGHYQQALAIKPDDHDIRLDLGIALLEAGRLDEARETLDQVIQAQPDRAQAHLFAGIAAYRAGDYQSAVPYLDRAVHLDPELRPHARYYAGLSQAFQGDLPAAQGSFEDVEQSPIGPLSRSAGNLRRELERGAPRAWDLSLTTGIEYDTNTLSIGGNANSLSIPNQKESARGVFRARSSYRLIDTERYNLTAGYEGYWSLHNNKASKRVDLQTHVGWASAGFNLDPVRFSLRYDFAYTFIDTSSRFRTVNRLTPSVTWRQGTWGVAQGFYQFEDREFLRASDWKHQSQWKATHRRCKSVLLSLESSERELSAAGCARRAPLYQRQ